MAKKKNTKHWSKKKINNKLFFCLLILCLLICAVTIYAYNSPNINKTHYSIQLYFQQLNWNWPNLPIKLHEVTPNPNNLSPHWLPCGQVNGGCAQYQHTYTFFINTTSQKITKPTGLGLNESDNAHTFTVGIGTFVDVDFGRVGNFHVTVTSPQNIFQCVGSGCLPHSSSPDSLFSAWVTRQGSAIIRVDTNTPEPSTTPTPTLAISVHQPNKLVVTRPKNITLNLSALTITVSNPALVKKIFDDILQLPVFDAPGTILMKCPNEISNPAVYTLTFYQDNKLTDTAVYRTTGCATITIDNYPARMDNDGWFDKDFQQAIALSGQSLYGYYPQNKTAN